MFGPCHLVDFLNSFSAHHFRRVTTISRHIRPHGRNNFPHLLPLVVICDRTSSSPLAVLLVLPGSPMGVVAYGRAHTALGRKSNWEIALLWCRNANVYWFQVGNLSETINALTYFLLVAALVVMDSIERDTYSPRRHLLQLNTMLLPIDQCRTTVLMHTP